MISFTYLYICSKSSLHTFCWEIEAPEPPSREASSISREDSEDSNTSGSAISGEAFSDIINEVITSREVIGGTSRKVFSGISRENSEDSSTISGSAISREVISGISREDSEDYIFIPLLLQVLPVITCYTVNDLFYLSIYM